MEKESKGARGKKIKRSLKREDKINEKYGIGISRDINKKSTSRNYVYGMWRCKVKKPFKSKNIWVEK